MYKIWFARNYRTWLPNTLLLDNALATMGAGLPSAMMAAMLHPEPARAGGVRRRRLHDELAGAGDRGPAEAEPRRPDPGRQRLRHDPLEAGGRQFRRLGPHLRQPGLRQVRRSLRREGSRVEATEALAPTLEAAFEGGGVHLVTVPIDYSENMRVLVDELRNRVPAAASA